MRFDGIAGGVQRFLEDLLCPWFQNWMERTGVRRVAYSGGVAMNVKANLAILQRCQPEALLVPGSGSDESLAIGACYHFAVERGVEVHPLDNMYLGDDVTLTEGRAAAERFRNDARYRVFDRFTETQFGRHIADGKILGRCVGRMEFGARALGNRSIIADPRDPETVRIVNDRIKSRDFWMPFAPAVLAKRTANYLHLHPGADYGYMTLAAETTDAGRKCLKAALHPADRTARPQVVHAVQNPRFHAMIREFEKLTGVGAVLNTSLNIHGYPIVRTAEDALEVLEKTDIDGMLVGDTLVLKRSYRDQARSRAESVAQPASEVVGAVL